MNNPKNFTTKQKGNLTELQCITACYKLGYEVSIPFGENCRYDFILDVNGKLLKIQVKTSSESEKNLGAFHFSTSSNRLNTKKSSRMSYSKDEIDYFATYWDGKCYLIPVEECGTSDKILRFVPPKNNQLKNINMASNYEIEKILASIV